jgi:ABC-type transport system involved in cytochrome bd biosynthesis fused ATPase/permease subunit
MRAFVYTLPVLGALAATLVMLLTMAGATTAPQEAAGYAMACALAVVPYVFARAIDLARDEAESHRNRQTKAMERLANKLAPEGSQS